MDSRRSRSLYWYLGLTTVIASAAVLTGYFHDQFAYLPDDGTYAYVAARLLEGDVLHRDVQDLHGGYINFINAAALKVFGLSLLSLRLPLVLVTIAQSALMFMLVSRTHIGLAVLSGLAMASLTFIQFLNPTANWYCLFLIVIIIWQLQALPLHRTSTLIVIGAMLGMIFLTRQLSGVITGVGVLMYLLHEMSTRPDSGDGLGVRVALGTLTAGLALYAWQAADPFTFLLLGAWPLIVGLLLTMRATAKNRDVARLFGWLGSGGLLASLPIVAYHLWHGSFAAFFDDVVLSAISLTGLGFIRDSYYSQYFIDSVVQILGLQSMSKTLNGLFWLLLLLAPTMLGVAIARLLHRRDDILVRQPLLLVALFFTLVSAHYQIPIYLFYSTALTLSALLVISSAWQPRSRAPVVASVAFAMLVGIIYHAGQPLSRNMLGIIEGQRTGRLPQCPIEAAGLRLERQQCNTYSRLIAVAGDADSILALPYGPEIYFLSGKSPPVRFINSAVGIRSAQQLDDTIRMIDDERPGVIFYRPTDKYNTAQTDEIVRWVQQHYVLDETIGDFEVYVPDAAARNP